MKSSKKKSNKKATKIVYCCGVDWQHEINEAFDLEGNMPLYSSMEELKAKKPCWEECGIVKLSLTIDEWVHPQDLLKKFKSK